MPTVGRGLMVFLLLAVDTVWANADYSMVLMGGGMQFCSSLKPRQCEKPLRVKSDTLVEYLYRVDSVKIQGISDSPWLPSRINTKKQIIDALRQVANITKGDMSKRQLLNVFRKTEVNADGQRITGAELLRSLHDNEYRLVLDWLQNPALEGAFFGRDDRKKIRVSLKQAKDPFTARVFNQFIELSKQLSKNRKPTILFITAGNSDVFSDVDLYQQVFKQLGVNAHWLPLDAAFLYATLENKGTKDNPYCAQIDIYRQLTLKRFQRAAIYPDLAEYQQELCREPEKLTKMLEGAQGIFFADGDPSLVKLALVNEDGSSSDFLVKIKSLIEDRRIVVAADGGGARAMTASYNNRGAMMLSGKSHQALTSGSLASSESLLGCEKQKVCPPGYVKNGLVYQPSGGLDLFEFGIVDSRLSERARQGRLIRLLADTPIRYGYGIDEKTALLANWHQLGDIEIKMEVVGQNGVTIFDSKEVLPSNTFKRDIYSIKQHYLTHGDQLFFRGNKLVVSFADWKYSSNKLSKPIIQSGNAFVKDNYRRTVNILCNTGAENATLKHSVVGKGHVIFVQKSRTSISLSGSRNINGKNYGYCSFRDYYVDVKAI